MILERMSDFGDIRGKLSLTPEQAKEMFGYTMKPGATGVVIQADKWGHVIIASSMPKTRTVTEKTKANESRWGIVTHMSHTHQQDLIVPIWNRAMKWVKRKEIMHGTNLFISTNCRRLGMPPDWTKLVISTGRLGTPDFDAVMEEGEVRIIPTDEMHLRIQSEELEVRVGMFDIKEGKLHHPISIGKSGKNFAVRKPFEGEGVVLVYLQKGEEYSESKAMKIHE